MGPVDYDRRDEVAVVTLHNPPVNALNFALRGALLSAFERADRDEHVRAVVLRGAGRGFSAGGDVREFGTPAVSAAPRLTSDVHPAIEGLTKPVVAALHGYAIGGGLETALVCHGRVAASDTLIALPEVTLGVLPPSGTQRLPRVLPLARALDMILTGTKYRAGEFADELFFNRLVSDPSTLEEIARSVALHIADGGVPFPLVRRLPVIGALSAVNQILADATQRLEHEAANGAHRQALAAIACAVNASDFDAGMREANAICEELLRSDEAMRAGQRFS